MKIKYNENGQIIKTVTIYTTKEDYEFKLEEQQANEIIRQFLDKRFVKVVEDDVNYYISSQQVVSIEVN